MRVVNRLFCFILAGLRPIYQVALLDRGVFALGYGKDDRANDGGRLSSIGSDGNDSET